MLIWSVVVCYKFHDFSSSNLSYYFFLLYTIFIAFIHVRVFGRNLFSIYEHIMVVFSVISLCLWGFDQVCKVLDELIEISKRYDNMETVRKMKAIMPEYKSNNSIYEKLD